MKLLIAGKIAGTHHLLGAVKVISELEGLSKLLGTKCMLQLENGEELLMSPKKIEHLTGNYWIFEFEEIKNRTDAMKLRNALIQVRRDLLGLEEEVFYSDYIGLLAKEVGTGEVLGKIQEVFETAAHPIFIIHSEKYETMVPDLPVFVKQVDFEKREIWVELLEGMKEEKRS